MSETLRDLFGLDGQVAVVTGGTGVLCGQIAMGLAAAGAAVVVVGRDAERGAERVAAIEAAGGRAVFVAASATERADLEAVLATAVATYGQVDILVNGAGMNRATPFLDITDEEWDQILAVNLKSVKIACQVFGQYFLDHAIAGSIVNLGSMSGLTPLSRVFTYSVSKAAMHNLTQNLAREWAPRGIRVNALAPGFFPAEQNRKILTEDRVRSILGHTPMGRFGEADELVGATLLLASRRAGSFITGIVLPVDGGFAAMTI
ncbi:MAG: SDR family oxidoreductase [Fimbriimonadaceae bacterium]|nr:SDR family oxidoreductase [Fimbriimonadaceae bacterium]